MSVLQRSALEASPLADLHALASELTIDGYRRLRREALIDAILERQGGAKAAKKTPKKAPRKAAKKAAEEPSGEPAAEGPAAEEAAAEEAAAQQAGEEESGEGAPRRRRRGGRSRSRATMEPEPQDAPAAAAAAKPAGESRGDAEAEALAALEAAGGTGGDDTPAGDEPIVEGVVELLPNGSGFVRVSPPDPSDEDIYISAAQVKRCELVSGDRVSGPRRAPRRSERFASLVRIDTINDRPASELADGLRYDELPAEFPSERFRLGSEDPTVKAIEWLTPFGRGSRVTVVGPSRAGKSEALQRLLPALAADEGLQCSLVLAGVRPEEIPGWEAGPVRPQAAVTIAHSPDAQLHAIELAVDQARRIAARGADALVAIDTLDGLPPAAARRALAAARNITGGGSLTVLATASAPVGGETTVIALDVALASTARYPALDLVRSGTMHAELLVGEAGAEAIARARAEAVEGA